MKSSLTIAVALTVSALTGIAAADDANAKKLFTSMGCIACHKIDEFKAGAVGPDLNKVGAKGKDYIKESILLPNKVIVPKFPPMVMPQDFGKRLKPNELNDLVEWLGHHK